MKLFLENIGKIGKAEIELNGITVIAGENDTGKSIISKALFSIFSGFYSIDYLIDRKYENLNISDYKMLKADLQNKFYEEFGGQISNIISGGKGEIKLRVKDNDLKVYIVDNKIIEIENINSLNSEVVYIDDPHIIDDMIPASYYQDFKHSDHRAHLRSQLSRRNQNENVTDKIIIQNKFERILKLISAVCSGDIIKNNRSVFEYKEANSDYTVAAKNLSTGLKMFAILKKVLLNGTLKFNGTIIFDEPESYLHPEWQLLFAEIIVLLQKDSGMHILLNTHSPYFLRAIQVYSAKYKVADKCKYYLSEKDNNLAHISDVTDDIEQIYSKLAYPLQKLENERWQDD